MPHVLCNNKITYNRLSSLHSVESHRYLVAHLSRAKGFLNYKMVPNSIASESHTHLRDGFEYS
jgi:hypothetical protein